MAVFVATPMVGAQNWAHFQVHTRVQWGASCRSVWSKLMKSKTRFVCNCGETNIVHVIAGRDLPNSTCVKCGSIVYGVGEVPVPDAVLSRSKEEIDGGDFALAIVFAAMAVECEVSQLFFKWKRIDVDFPPSDDAIEEELRNAGGVLKKFDLAAGLLVSKGFDEFMADPNNTDLADFVAKMSVDLTKGPIKKNIQERLFWLRNRILHFGDTGFDATQATSSWRIAAATIQILRTMDNERNSELRRKYS